MAISSIACEPSLVEIPGEYTFWKTHNVPPERIQLPLEARAKFGAVEWLVLLPITLMFVVLAAVCFAALCSLLWSPQPLMRVLIVVPSCMFAVLWGAFLGAMTLRIVADCRAKTARLVVDRDGILDRRLFDQKIAWTSVARAEIYHLRSGPGGVILHIKDSAVQPHSRRRFDPFFWRNRDPLQCYVGVIHMNVTQRRLALAIVKLVRAHGGEIGSNFPAWLGDDPDLKNL